MTTLTLPIIKQLPRLLVAEYHPAVAVDLSVDDLAAAIQTNMREIVGIQIAMQCTGTPVSGDTGRLRVGVCLHPSQNEIVEASQYRGLTAGLSPTADTDGAIYGWLNDVGADNLWPPITATVSGGQLQVGGMFEAVFKDLAAPLCARYVNIDWRKGDLGAGLVLDRLAVFVHFAD